MDAASALTPWANFYIMAGSSAAALTGLMFVVITLVTGVERVRRSPDGVSTFSTPTVVHFCVALLVSALVSAPWHSLTGVAIPVGVTGAYGIVACIRVTLRSRSLVSEYTPDAEDWTWYTVLPFLSYVALFVGAIDLLANPAPALFSVAGGVLALILIGIHNAWDVVTYLAIGPRSQTPDEKPDAQ